MKFDLSNPALQEALNNFKRASFAEHVFRNMSEDDYSGDLPLSDQRITVRARLRVEAWMVLTFYNGTLLNAIRKSEASEAKKDSLSNAHRETMEACFTSDRALLRAVEMILGEAISAG